MNILRSAVLAALLFGCALEPVDAEPTTYRGTVTQVTDRSAIAGAIVQSIDGEFFSTTDAQGVFEFVLPAGTHRFVFASADHEAIERPVTLAPGVLRDDRVELTPTELTANEEGELIERRLEAQLLRDDPWDPALRPEARAFLLGQISDAELRGAVIRSDGIGGTRASLESPPATVRIWRRGLDGSTRSCSGRVDVLEFEEYIKGVLPHEWIPSWHDNSLRAGSLAIRTYIWNWVRRGGKYDCADLDDTARSQVYRDDRTDRATAAVDLTRGQAITRNGELVSGEYSAENGTPTADGIDDPLCEGRELFGHGRGMCQWGSQRWARNGRDHIWIAEHYWPGGQIEGGEDLSDRYVAELVQVVAPAVMIAGERAVAYVEVQNQGTAPFDDRTFLATTGPRDRDGVFYDLANWPAPNRPTEVDYETLPSDIARFTFMIRAPETDEEVELVDTFGFFQEGIGWFGPEDVTLRVRVLPAGALPDNDGDGSSSAADCDDSNPAFFPGATEICGDGLDQDCTGEDLPCDLGTPLEMASENGDLNGGCSVGGRSEAPILLLVVVALYRLRRNRVS
ncbi:MAG: SpoIID/LytB domain-containing protein [Myxococcota bacterium]